MPGAFALAQPLYAAIGIPTYPLTADKTPLVHSFEKMGLPASRQLQLNLRFAEAPCLATLGGERNKRNIAERNRLTVIDIDATGRKADRLLEDVQREHGESRFIVRTGSGGFHAYYRHKGERRDTARRDGRPIDILGTGGLIILPPSRSRKGLYEIVHGRIEDLARLEPLKRHPEVVAIPPPSDELLMAPVGCRNDHVWRYIDRLAQHARSRDELLKLATDARDQMVHPYAEIEKHVEWSWKNRDRRRAQNHDHALIDQLTGDTDVLAVILILRRIHGSRVFAFANEMHEMLNWSRKRLAAVRARTIELGLVTVVREATRYTPMNCQLAQQCFAAPRGELGGRRGR
jgi:hypothetical protein